MSCLLSLRPASAVCLKQWWEFGVNIFCPLTVPSTILSWRAFISYLCCTRESVKIALISQFFYTICVKIHIYPGIFPIHTLHRVFVCLVFDISQMCCVGFSFSFFFEAGKKSPKAPWCSNKQNVTPIIIIKWQPCNCASWNYVSGKKCACLSF